MLLRDDFATLCSEIPFGALQRAPRKDVSNEDPDSKPTGDCRWQSCHMQRYSKKQWDSGHLRDSHWSATESSGRCTLTVKSSASDIFSMSYELELPISRDHESGVVAACGRTTILPTSRMPSHLHKSNELVSKIIDPAICATYYMPARVS